MSRFDNADFGREEAVSVDFRRSFSKGGGRGRMGNCVSSAAKIGVRISRSW
jgi:hypothetical protein